MIASHESHSIVECANGRPLPSLFMKDGSAKHQERISPERVSKEQKRIVSLDEIVWIEGTVTVSF